MPSELVDGIYLFKLTGLPSWFVNAYLIDADEITLIDSGTPLNASTVEGYLGELGYKPEDIDNILLTHYDLDHFGGITRLDHDADVYAGKPDADYLAGNRKPPFLHHKGVFHRFLAKVIPDMDVKPLEDGDEVAGFEAVHTPGHNPGHMAYIHTELETAFLGDLVWQREDEIITPFWFDSYNLPTLRRSVKKLADHPANFKTAGFGHGKPIVNDGAKEKLVTFAEKLS